MDPSVGMGTNSVILTFLGLHLKTYRNQAFKHCCSIEMGFNIFPIISVVITTICFWGFFYKNWICNNVQTTIGNFPFSYKYT